MSPFNCWFNTSAVSGMGEIAGSGLGAGTVSVGAVGVVVVAIGGVSAGFISGVS